MGIKMLVQEVHESSGGWKNIIANGTEYGLPPGKGAVQAGKTYEFEIFSKESNGKTRLFIRSVNPVDQGVKNIPAPNSQSILQSSFDREKSVARIADLKNKSIEQASVLKAKCTGWECAVAVAMALVEKNGKQKKIQGKKSKKNEEKKTKTASAYESLKLIRDSEYQIFLEIMGLHEGEPSRPEDAKVPGEAQKEDRGATVEPEPKKDIFDVE